MKGKLIDGVLTYQPNILVYNNVRYSAPIPEAVSAALGWKEIIYTDMPTDAPSYKHYESSWQDGETITQAWTLTDDSNEQICATLRDWFDTNYRTWNEMLTRWQAMGIAKTITDKLRGKTYSSLADLYSEAEAVSAEIEALEK